MIEPPTSFPLVMRAVPWTQRLFRRLDEDGVRVVRVDSSGANRWLLRLRLPETLRQTYGTAPEILLLAVHGEVEGRDLERARLELYENEFELDPDLLVVTDDRPQLAQRLDWLLRVRGQWIPWSAGQDGFPPLAEQLRHHLPAFDVFEQRDPVRGRQVIGRKEVVADCSKRLLRGQAIGVFGLRKVGKTTVVRAVTDRLDPLSGLPALRRQPTAQELRRKSAMLWVWCDVQLVLERTLESVGAELVRRFERRLELEKLSPPTLPESSLGRLKTLLQFAFEHCELPLGLVLDEYDLLFEGSQGEPAIAGIEKLFRLFRAYAQENGRLALVVIGRDPHFFQRPEMGRRTNPMLNWFIPRWLGPLASAGADELLEKLGRRVLLEVGPDTLSHARRWTGGHPLLHRQYGSALLEIARSYPANRGDIATDDLYREALDLFLGRQEVIATCHDVDHLLTSRYREAANLLAELSDAAQDQTGQVIAAHGGWQQPAVRALRDFGLLLGESEDPVVPEVFRWYLRTLAPSIERLSA